MLNSNLRHYITLHYTTLPYLLYLTLLDFVLYLDYLDYFTSLLPPKKIRNKEIRKNLSRYSKKLPSVIKILSLHTSYFILPTHATWIPIITIIIIIINNEHIAITPTITTTTTTNTPLLLYHTIISISFSASVRILSTALPAALTFASFRLYFYNSTLPSPPQEIENRK